MKQDDERDVDMVGWVQRAMEARAAKKKAGAGASATSSAPVEGPTSIPVEVAAAAVQNPPSTQT
jgi:hypothetical protein